MRMLPIMAVVASIEFGLRISLGVQGGCHISTGRKDFAGSSTGVQTLREGLEIELSDF
jgi:hypothetical protein